MAIVLFKKSKMRYAIEHNNLHEMSSLLERGVDPNMADDYGSTFLHYAVNLGNYDAARLLVERGARVGTEGTYNGTILHLAAIRGSLEIARMLIEKEPALVHAKNRQGNTPLHVAAKQGYADIVELLIARGADAGVKNYENRTAFFLAQQGRHEDVARMLKQHQRPPLSPPPAEEDSIRSAGDAWVKISEDKIARVSTSAEIGYRITEIFNFKTHERTSLYRNLETRAEAVESRDFSDFPDKAPIEEALRELEKRGGRGSVSPLQKKRFDVS